MGASRKEASCPPTTTEKDGCDINSPFAHWVLLSGQESMLMIKLRQVNKLTYRAAELKRKVEKEILIRVDF